MSVQLEYAGNSFELCRHVETTHRSQPQRSHETPSHKAQCLEYKTGSAWEVTLTEHP
jgi:hypothetical protein